VLYGKTEKILHIETRGTGKEASSLDRALGAGIGAAVGMIAGPVTAILAAGAGATIAGQRWLRLTITAEAGLHATIRIKPAQLQALELAAHKKAV
jgi:hypothetical protein